MTRMTPVSLSLTMSQTAALASHDPLAWGPMMVVVGGPMMVAVGLYCHDWHQPRIAPARAAPAQWI